MQIPLLSDMGHKISKDYGCLINKGGDAGITFRATYIIGPDGILRHKSLNDLAVGRSVDEVFRLVKAF
jgi:peroxiredoxin (alkyl hydroperoxide reductase subunit C)